MHGLEENSLLSANLWAGMGGDNLLSAVEKKPLIKVCCRVRVKKKDIQHDLYSWGARLMCCGSDFKKYTESA